MEEATIEHEGHALQGMLTFVGIDRWAMKKNGWLGYIGDYTTQLYRDYNKPL